jgi:hypothetical protein
MLETLPLFNSRIIRTAASVVCLLIVYFTLIANCSAENAISVGYGFGIWNDSGTARVENKRSYDYATIAYLYEKPLSPKIAFVLEPYCNIINRPRDGVDVGFSMYLKAYLPEVAPDRRFYLTVGGGAAYTTIKFKEQGTYVLGVLQGGIGYRQGRFFVEDRFHHYSNGGLAKPNRSVNSNILKVGYYF